MRCCGHLVLPATSAGSKLTSCTGVKGSRMVQGRAAYDSWELLEAAQFRDPSTIDAVRTLTAHNGDRLLSHDPIWLFGSGDDYNRGGGSELPIAYLLRRDD